MNTANWFEAKVKYVKVGEDGRERKVSEMCLLDAMSYTEAESRIVSEMEMIVKGDYNIASLKKSNISEVVTSEDKTDDRWYKAKIAIIDADEVSGKEKSSYQYYLVAAANTNQALENLEKALATFVVPYEISSIADTLFVDVFPYIENPQESTAKNTLK